jgi:hypothetical protein
MKDMKVERMANISIFMFVLKNKKVSIDTTMTINKPPPIGVPAVADLNFLNIGVDLPNISLCCLGLGSESLILYRRLIKGIKRIDVKIKDIRIYIAVSILIRFV